jgi:predicted small secreted protein
MMKTMRILLIALSALATLSLAACNTVHGFGKDVEKAGEVIQKGSGK